MIVFEYKYECKLGLSINSCVFVGELVTLDNYKIRCEERKGGYGVKIRKGEVLDCYSSAKEFKCLASYSNSPRNARTLNGEILRANCRICICSRTNSVSLKVVAKIVHSGSELLWYYGTSYCL